MVTPIGVRTIPSVSMEEAKKRVLTLYREWIRAAPSIVRKYPLDVSVAKLRRQVRFEFEKKRGVKELPVIDTLIAKGTMELVETFNIWKQTTHVMKYFEDHERREENLKKKNFMNRFLS